KLRHFLHEGTGSKSIAVTRSSEDLALIYAEIEKQSSSSVTRKTKRLLCKILRAAALRRSEGLRLTVDMIPSKVRLERLRRHIAAGTAEPLISFEIISSKNGGRREISLPFSLAVELREYINIERADLLRRIGV